MKVVQVGPYPISDDCIRGGVESSVYGLVCALAVAGHEVVVLDVPRIEGQDKVECTDNVLVNRYQNTGRHNKDAVERTAQMLEDIVSYKPDIVHIHGTSELSRQLYLQVKQKNITVMLTVHGLQHIEKQNALKKQFSLKHLYQYFNISRSEFRLLNIADNIIVDTNYVSEQISDYFHRGKIKHLPRMQVIPQGINEKYLDIYKDKKEQHHLVLSVGSISKRKGHLLLLKAFNKLSEKHHSAELIIAGTLAERDYYDNLIDEWNISPYKQNIKILTDLPQEQLFRLYSKASIFALHSQEESQGIAIVEAMAAGLPVVATNVGGIPHVVNNSVTGLLSDYADVDAFAQNMYMLLENRKLCSSMATKAHKEAMSYTWQSIAQRIVNLYEAIK